MNVQTFFPELGVDLQLTTQLAVIEEQIESCNRLRRHALKIKNFGVAGECDKELVELGETARAMRSLLAMRQHGTPSPGQGLNVPVIATQNGQQPSEAGSRFLRSETESTLKSNSPSSLCGGVGAIGRTTTTTQEKEKKCSSMC